MGQPIESDYGFIESAKDKLTYLSKTFYNLKSEKIDDYFKIKISSNTIRNFPKQTMPTFSVDDLLPSMPVPDLNNTLAKYLESVQPFLNHDEYKNTQKIVEKFKNGVGLQLHGLLLEKAKHERNWLEKYWLDYAYLEWRDPIVPFVNTAGFIGGNAQNDFKYIPEDFKLNLQLSYSAIRCYYYMKFFEELINETYAIHKSRSQYFSMDQWKRLFNTCRIPGIDIDRLDCHFKTLRESCECPTHLVIIYKHRFYRLDTYHENKLLNITEFYKQLEKIVNNKKNDTYGVGIGALSADYRTSWAHNRNYLINLHSDNKKSFDQIEQSTFVVVLDDDIAHDNSDLSKLGLCGNPKNRYFDKSYQAIITKNGRYCSNIDHTPFDGMVSGSVVHYSVHEKNKSKWDISQTDSLPVRRHLLEPQELHFVYDSKIENEIKKSADNFYKNSSELICKDFVVQNCDKELLKSFRVNPETTSQMCMQLAYYQMHNKPGATYQTATTRAYYHGRTETVRSCTLEAIEWCKQMSNKNKSTRLSDKELLSLFHKACKKHDKLMFEARQNAGVDRHLTGLRLVARDLDIKTPEIFTDSAWKKSGGDGNFVISSSCLGSSNAVGTCAAMCLDGYSMIFSFPDKNINFVLGRYKSSKETCLENLSKHLQSAFEQLKGLHKISSKI